jgi:hypothetical protein
VCQLVPLYSFETGTTGWTNLGAPGTSSATSFATAYDGVKSLAFTINGSGDPAISVTPAASPPGGTTITARVFVPTNAPVIAVSPYVLDANWVWTDGYTAGVPKGSWQTVTVTVPEGAALPLNRVGVKFHMSGSYAGPLYIDAVGW